MRLITTSWDDGHPLDFRIAELMHKYGLQGTFYIPQHNGSQQMMNDLQVQELSRHYEIGGHTLNHVWLNNANHAQWNNEIQGSFDWLKNITGNDPVSFCFPGGIYNDDSISAVFKGGYRLARTAELLSTTSPVKGTLFGTSLQMFQHSGYTYAKHLVKRGRWKRLMIRLLHAPTTSLMKLTEYYLNTIQRDGGCFHLWGHSWEIEQYGLWKKLEALLQLLSQRKDFHFVQNRQLLDY